MPKPFNFFQYGETGDGANITPFSTYFSGFYLPVGVSIGKEEGFLLTLRDDSFFNPPTLTLAINTDIVKSNTDNPSINIGINGSLFPVLPETLNNSIVISGKTVRNNIDYFTFYPSLSGESIASQKDESNINVTTSGKLIGHTLDNPTINLYISGDLGGGINDQSSINVNFSGELKGVNKNISTISFYLGSITYESGNYKVSLTTGDSSSVSFALSSISWES